MSIPNALWILTLSPYEPLSGTIFSPSLLAGHATEIATDRHRRQAQGRLPAEHPHHVYQVAGPLDVVVVHVGERGAERGHAPRGVHPVVAVRLDHLAEDAGVVLLQGVEQRPERHLGQTDAREVGPDPAAALGRAAGSVRIVVSTLLLWNEKSRIP